MKLREYEPSGHDAATIATFACTTGAPYEDEVESWIRTAALGWVNDIPRATFQRRKLAFIEDDANQVVALLAWLDITRVDLDGVWLEVLAVATDHQHRTVGRQALDLAVDHLRTIDRDGDHLAGLVHVDNLRSKRLLAGAGWQSIAPWDEHELRATTL